MRKCLILSFLALLAVPCSFSQSIFIVTDDPQMEAPGAGNLGDFLRGLGYSVEVDEGVPTAGQRQDDVSAYRGALTATEIAHLESFDLVIFHRSTSSGDFNQPASWNPLRVPILNGSAFTARNNPARWNWANAAQANEVSQYLLVRDESHVIFTGITIANGEELEMYQFPQSIDALNTGFDDANAGNGTVLADTEINFHAALIVWNEAGAFIPGNAETHTHRRVFFPLLRYFENDPANNVNILFSDYSEDGLKLIANVVEYTIKGTVTGEPPTGVAEWAVY